MLNGAYIFVVEFFILKKGGKTMNDNMRFILQLTEKSIQREPEVDDIECY